MRSCTVNYQSLQSFISSEMTSRDPNFQLFYEAQRLPNLLCKRNKSFSRSWACCWREQPQNESHVTCPQLCSTCWSHFKWWQLNIYTKCCYGDSGDLTLNTASACLSATKDPAVYNFKRKGANELFFKTSSMIKEERDYKTILLLKN